MDYEKSILAFETDVEGYIFLLMLIILNVIIMIPLTILFIAVQHQNKRHENHIQKLKILRETNNLQILNKIED